VTNQNDKLGKIVYVLEGSTDLNLNRGQGYHLRRNGTLRLNTKPVKSRICYFHHRGNSGFAQQCQITDLAITDNLLEIIADPDRSADHVNCSKRIICKEGKREIAAVQDQDI
jgi:hypothetical protein